MEGAPIKVLMIEDDPDDAKLIQYMLMEAKNYTFQVELFDRVSTGVARLDEEHFDIILLDLHLPDSYGLETVYTVVPHAKTVPIIVFTMMGDIEIATNAIRAGAQDYLVKDSVDSDKLVRAIRYALERKQIQDAVCEERDKAQQYLDIVGVIMLVINADETVSMINRKGCEVLGYKEQDILGQSWFDLCLPERWKGRNRAFFQKAMGGEFEPVPNDESVILTSEEEQRFISWKYALLRDASGNIFGMLCSGEDITERKTAEEHVSDALNRAEFFNDLMMRDISNLFQNIQWAMESIKQLHSLNDAAGFYQLIDDHIQKAWDLLDKVQKFSDIDTKSLQFEAIDIEQSLSHAIQDAKNDFPGKQLILTTNITPRTLFVLADDFLVDVFSNILHNAMRFDTQEEVQVEVEAAVDENNTIKIQIKDHGPGIPDVNKMKIFTRLIHRQGRLSVGGVGLALVARIIDRYNGKIWVEDRVPGDSSQGANFVILLVKLIES